MAKFQNYTKGRFIIFGLDGATWDVIDPMIQKGLLPNIKHHIDHGVRGDLKSLEVTMSPRVWTSIASGKEADKHGIYNFRNNISHLKSKRIFDIVSSIGEKVNIFYWYLTWPPPKNLQGFVVPGFLAQDNRTIPEDLSFLKDIELSEKMKVQESQNIAKPLFYLKSGIRAIRNGVKFTTLFHAFRYFVKRKLKSMNELEMFYELQTLKLKLYGEVFINVFKKNFLEFSAIMLPQPDQIGHKFWSFMEPDEYEKKTGVHVDAADIKRFGNSIYNCYQEIDKMIGQLTTNLTPDDTIFIVSDHGFGLVEKPLASLKIRGNNFLKLVGLQNNANCMSVGINYIIKINENLSKENVGKISDKIKNIEVLESREKLFDVTNNDKEIILELRNIFSMYLSDAEQFLQKEINIGGQKVKASEILINRSDITGEHKDLGILVVNGKNIKPGVEIDNASVLDIVPTILYLKNLAVGKDMDGKVLLDSIDHEYVKNHTVKYIDTYETEITSTETEKIDQSMTEDIETRLRDLGYLD